MPEKKTNRAKRESFRICVVGGAGLTGQCAVRDLLRSAPKVEIIVADHDLIGLRVLRKKLGEARGRIAYRKIDVRNHRETAKVFSGCDVVVNAVQYYFNLDVMSAALEARANYLDFGGLYHTTLKQIEKFDSRFRSMGLLAVVGMGAQPGVSNLMVKYALQKYESASTIEIFDGWRDNTKSNSPIYFTWSPLTFFDESSKEAIVFQEGKYVKRPPFSDEETVVFPQPVGKVNVYTSLHSELATIPSSFRKYGLKNVVWKEGGADFWKVKFLADLGLTSAEKIRFNGMRIAPREYFLKLLQIRGTLRMPEDTVPQDYEITRVVVKGLSKSDRKRKTTVIDARFPSYPPWRVSCSQYNVGVPGSIAAQLIMTRSGMKNGVLPPEKVFEPIEFFQELEKRNIRVSEVRG